MILVMLGTQDKSFKRLLEYVENLNTDEEIICQCGYTKFTSNKLKTFNYIEKDKLTDLIKVASFVICHGGVGTIMECLKHNKKVIACPRLSKYNEHQNDHQIQIINNFKNEGYLLSLNENQDINEIVNELLDSNLKKYNFNNDSLINKLIEYIDNN